MRSITMIAIVAIGLILTMMGCGKYNSFVEQEGIVENSWSKVQSAYQRRADLIPNLVNTVKGQADYEKGTLEAVVKARASATSTNIDASQLTPENMAQFQQAQGQLSSALSRLLVTVEKYPDLKANQAFIELQTQLEGTENRIKVARDNYNDAVTTFNISIRKFPSNFFATVFGFDDKAQFEAQAGSDQAPEVQF
ncbi:MAG: LemA family protein [Bacteroidetes bacterium]|jgi:LemA protein|nr:LemA family protein [Bacteroidota bacterium]MDF1868451.1 LemA family protein [Saprospiraceae bacterium]